MAEPDGTENLPPATALSTAATSSVDTTASEVKAPVEVVGAAPDVAVQTSPVEKAAVAPVEAEVIGPETTAAAIPEIPVAEEPAVEETKKVLAEPASVVQEEDAVEPADDLAAEAVKPVVVSAVAEATPEVKAPVEVAAAAPAVAVQTAPVEKAAVETEVIGPESTAAAIPEIPVAEEPAVEETKKVPAEPASAVEEEDAVEPADDLAAEAVKPVVESAVAEATPEVKAPVEVMGAAPAVAVQTAPVEKATVAPVEPEVIGPESTAAAIPLPVAEEPAVEETKKVPAEPASAAVEEDAVTVEPAGYKKGWVVAGLIVLVAVSLHALSSQSPPEQKEVRRVDVFLKELEMIQSKFPTQRPELWRRGRIHLKRHLQMEQPTEPVSLILTAGRKAEKTLHCLARGLTSAFSSALNASVLHIDGASKAHLDSDQVKLDIDSQLRGAFEGDKPVAVIHRFEELPPGSTLIFYRYCDHENAAYKKVFLIFTVLLAGEEELPTKLSLSTVEEMVDDHLKKKFLSAGHAITFDRMDLDKYSGLWSRISHLILPVASEETMEPEGCQET